MKKKLLSLLLLCAMVVSLLPAARAEAAGIAYLYNKKNPSAMLTTGKNTYIYVGGAKINLDYNISGKTSGIKGSWSSSKPEIITVDKYGICRAVGNGVSIITFTYKQSGKTNKVQCRLKALTRATGITLESSTAGFEGTMKINSAAGFAAKLTVNPKALTVNPEAETTYGVYYNLYADASCTTAANESIATVNSAGLVVAKAEGTVYLRATGKNSPNAKNYNVQSNVIAITIKSDTSVEQIASNQFRITASEDILSIVVKGPNGQPVTSTMTYPAENNKTTAVATTSISPLKGDYTVTVNGKDNYTVACQEAVPSKIELTSNYAILDKLYADANGYPKAYIYFKLYDQFGNDITTSTAYPTSRFLGIWDNYGTATFPEQGVAALDFTNSKTTAPVVGTAYSIQLLYTGSDRTRLTATVTLGEPAQVKELDFAGIYTYQSIVDGYKKVADSNLNNITTGTTIVPYANSITTVGAYYLLVSAKDQYGNSLARSGVKQDTVATMLNSTTTNLALATTESINSITIDGVKYLTYPLSAGTTGKLEKGTATLILSGGTLGSTSPKTVVLTIAETAGISNFQIHGNAYMKKTGNSYTPVDGYVNFVVTNTAGNVITDFDTLVTLTGALKTGNIAYINNANMIYSPNNTIFRWEKQADGSAKLYYMPTTTCLLTGGTINMVGVDTITTLRGTANESSNNSIIVYVQE